MTTSMGIRLRATHTSAFSRREGVRGVREFSAFHWEGRGECREPTHPQPRMQSKKAYELVTTGKPDYPAFPHAMVLTVSFVISPVIGLSCHRRLASAAKLDASVEASGPHDFAVRVQHRSSAVPNSVHRIPSRVRDDRERPSVGRDGAIGRCFASERKQDIFSDWAGQVICETARPASLRAQRSNPASEPQSWIASSLHSSQSRSALYEDDRECADPRHCERSEAIQLCTPSWNRTSWIASSLRSQ